MAIIYKNITDSSINYKIRSELDMIFEIEDLRRDPIGTAIYLHFYLENRRRGPDIDALISWMNEWVHDILNNENISRSVDVEVTSAIMGYSTLRKNRKLKKTINIEKINKILSRYFENNHYFQNFTLSVFIGYALVQYKEMIENYYDLISWIKNMSFNESVLSDGKNIAFSFLLFKDLNEHKIIDEIFKYCNGKIQNNDIMFSDELYYSYVLWNNKDLLKNRSQLRYMRRFVEDSLLNAKEHIEKYDINNVSKIYKGIFIDLINKFEKNTIKVIKEEVSLDDLTSIILIIPTISFTLIFTALYYGYHLLSGRFDGLILQYFDFSVIDNVKLGVLFIISIFLIISGSMFWDVVYKKHVTIEVITQNLYKRLISYIKWSISPTIALGLIIHFT
jgi:hypothetical protein